MSLLARPIGAHGAIVPIIVTVSAPDLWTLESRGKSPPPPQRVLGLADTGANRTCVHPAVLRALELSPAVPVHVTTPLTAGAGEKRSGYRVALVIPARIPGEPPLVFDTLEVVSAELQSDFGVQALLGRDVLERCLLLYHGPERRFTLAY